MRLTNPNISRRALLAGLACLPAASSLPQKSKAQIVFDPKPAPHWHISEWINGDGGNIDTNAGKVIVVDFFQLWCPGCNSFSGPLIKKWQEKYQDAVKRGDLHLVKIHTVFEGHKIQTVKRLKRYVKEKNITMPVGVDRHKDGEHIPMTMARYRTRGTPEMAIIDKGGVVQFQQFGFFDPDEVEPQLEKLIAA